VLFKYFERPHILVSGLVRFSQPGALNDPEDSLPQVAFDVYSPEDYAAAREYALGSGFPFMSEEDLEHFALAPYPAARLDEKGLPGLWPRLEPRLRDIPFKTAAEMDRALAERAVQLYLNWANRSIGVFCLTKSTDERMWAYYARSHAGVAIGFDERHPFFAKARPMIYSDQPMSISSNEGTIRFGGVQWNSEDILNGIVRAVPQDILFRKRSTWSHENEWRIFDQLSAAAKIDARDENGYPVHLFEVPRDAVKLVILGYRASDDLVADTLRNVANGWDHLVVLMRRQSSTGLIGTEQIWP
jgi:Protein of unknown function (DUF2971)